jgi:hypothetical protein
MRAQLTMLKLRVDLRTPIVIDPTLFPRSGVDRWGGFGSIERRTRDTAPKRPYAEGGEDA